MNSGQIGPFTFKAASASTTSLNIGGDRDFTGSVRLSLKLTRVNRPPVAEQRALAVARDGTLPITLAGSAADRTYTPQPGYAGADKLTLRATDPEGLSAVGRITISVVAPRAGAPSAAPTVCISDLVLHEVRRAGRRVQFAGIADPGFAGIPLEILEDARVIANPTVGGDGAFSATATLPPGGSVGPIRYRARIGPLSSRRIRLGRRLIEMRVTPAGDGAVVSGRIVGARQERVLVTLAVRRHACGAQYARVGSARVGSDGRFRARIARPTGSGRVILRAQARLPGQGATYSLPQVLGAR